MQMLEVDLYQPNFGYTEQEMSPTGMIGKETKNLHNVFKIWLVIPWEIPYICALLLDTVITYLMTINVNLLIE